jgi:hypothetical protein
MAKTNTTPFSLLYDNFLSKITSDMYMELNEIDTYRLLHELMINAIHKFEFPRKNINNYYDEEIDEIDTYQGVESNGIEVPLYIMAGGYFNVSLT